MKILFTISLTALYFFSFGQVCTITTSNLFEISGDDGSGNCIYSIDILFTEGSGPDNGTLTFSSPSATILSGAGPHDCACSGTTYTLTFEATCGSIVSFAAFHDNSGNGNDCSVTLTGITLDVEWLLFDLRKENQNTIVLNWSTATELNNESFEIEYSSDGKIFEYLSEIPGAGTSYEINNYTYRHVNTSSGISYYRIKQIDFDGNYSYSEIRHTSIHKNSQFSIFPNPTRETLYILGDNNSVAKFQILDVQGNSVMSTENYQIDLSQLKAGCYTLLIDNNGQIQSHLFIKSE